MSSMQCVHRPRKMFKSLIKHHLDIYCFSVGAFFLLLSKHVITSVRFSTGNKPMTLSIYFLISRFLLILLVFVTIWYFPMFISVLKLISANRAEIKPFSHHFTLVSYFQLKWRSIFDFDLILLIYGIVIVHSVLKWNCQRHCIIGNRF